jgi:transaldolase
VKISATRAGVAAIEDSIAAGRSINVTLIFSIDRYVEVGIDYNDVVETLETEGIQKFSDAFSKLLSGLQRKAEALTATGDQR